MEYQVLHYINGQKTAGHNPNFHSLINPADGEKIGQVSYGSEPDVLAAVESAQTAFAAWSQFSPTKRAQVFLNYQHLLKDNIDALAQMITREHGKTLSDAKGSIQRGIEVVEFVCGLPAQLAGMFSENVGTNVDTYSIRQPLGVCVGITPYNFPAMIPLWMFPIAVMCGNTFILKPSERDPSCALKLAELFTQAGAPAGVLNVVHGDKTVVDVLLKHPEIKAVSFVGSTTVAEYIYTTGAHYGKRVQAFGSAKNHAVVLPDADITFATDALMGAGYGSAGQRCMATSVVVAIGDQVADQLVAGLTEQIARLKIGVGTDTTAEMGPLVSQAQKQRVVEAIKKGVDEGARLVVDGREFQQKGLEKGFFLGATLFDHVKPHMHIYQEEIFGPVLCIVRVKTLDEAIQLINQHAYGNGTAIFTRDGESARNFASRVEVGMIGINVPIPVPIAYHNFGGWKLSSFGSTHLHGPDSIYFYTRQKTVTSRWPKTTVSSTGAEFFMPNVNKR